MGLSNLTPLKLKSLLFSRRINVQAQPTLFFNDIPIQEVVSLKHFGVYLYLRCDWQTHIDFIKEKGMVTIKISPTLEAGRIVTGAMNLVEIDKLSERKDRNKNLLVFKMNHGLAPLYLSILHPPMFGMYLPIGCVMLKTM